MADSAAKRRPQDPWPPLKPKLGAWWRDHARIARETGYFVSQRLTTSLLVWLLVGIALALPAGLFLLQANLADMTAAWDGRPGLTVYFELAAPQAQIDAAAQALVSQRTIESVAITSRQDALAEFRQFSNLADALDLLGSNPLPASLRATLTSGAEIGDLDRLAQIAAPLPGVAEVVVEKTWLERVTDISQVVSRLGMVLGVLFGVGAVLVTATSVRLAIESRLDELRVLKLVGATDRQIRRPFLYFGAFYGLGGAVVAAMLISISLVIVETPLTNLLGSFSENLEMAGFDPIFLLWLLLVGACLGIAGALLAATQRLKDLEIL